ncbi:MAG: polyprenyl synthetase family protein, partial [Treponema sp.]|nr:polyprenyl synthetase family protein [Treponema sp.]
FRRLGYNIGIAFQFIDDILDYSGEHALQGKALGSDIHAGIVTLPVICALRSNKSSVLNDIFSRREFTQEEAGIIFTQVQHYTGAQAAAEYASRYTSRALRDIAGLPPGENRNTLETLTNCLLVRQY